MNSRDPMIAILEEAQTQQRDAFAKAVMVSLTWSLAGLSQKDRPTHQKPRAAPS